MVKDVLPFAIEGKDQFSTITKYISPVEKVSETKKKTHSHTFRKGIGNSSSTWTQWIQEVGTNIVVIFVAVVPFRATNEINSNQLIKIPVDLDASALIEIPRPVLCVNYGHSYTLN